MASGTPSTQRAAGGIGLWFRGLRLAAAGRVRGTFELRLAVDSEVHTR